MRFQKKISENVKKSLDNETWHLTNILLNIKIA